MQNRVSAENVAFRCSRVILSLFKTQLVTWPVYRRVDLGCGNLGAAAGQAAELTERGLGVILWCVFQIPSCKMVFSYGYV